MRPLRLLVVVLAGPLLTAGKCPLQVGNTPQPGHGGDPAEVIDLGGTRGASWRIRTESELTVTLRTISGTASAKASATESTVSLLGRLLALGDFCFRVDVVCPHQVLKSTTRIAQPSGSSNVLLIDHSQRGLLGPPTPAALSGQLDGTELSVSLASQTFNGGTPSNDPCQLQTSSAVLATAIVDNDTAQTPDAGSEGDNDTAQTPDAGSEGDPSQVAQRLKGRVTVVYGGLCFSIGGSGSLEASDNVEISVGFEGTRQ